MSEDVIAADDQLSTENIAVNISAGCLNNN
jgi:hypothetical protein